ncbi:MAG: pyridoxal phosphate-dependent aminotransferase [Deltaproteobacteria bacterium]|nr:pyridoxal phosphate-dependent aminotransferase [Deltaproteobacteria bacterium]
MATAKKIQEFIGRSSWIRKMFEEGMVLAKQYGAENVFDFSLGNPNIPPPPELKQVIRELLDKNIPGMHDYGPNAGYPDTREAVAAFLRQEYDVDALTADHIIMTCGAGGALNVALKALLDPGDEVVIPVPYFVEYGFYTDNAGGVPKMVNTKEDFSLDLEAMAEAMTEKTKIVLINSPNNPTGKVYDEATIRGLAALLEAKSAEFKKDIYLLSDEPYREIVYDNVKVPSLLKNYKNSIIGSSYSKTLSIPGERIGFLAASPDMTDVEDVIAGLILCNRILGYVNAPVLMQRVVARLQGVRVNVAEYKRKRDLLCDGLAAFGYQFSRPEGAFYLFPKTPIPDDIEFVRALQQKRILAVPGTGFGAPGYFRLAYCVADETIIKALPGFEQVIKEIVS